MKAAVPWLILVGGVALLWWLRLRKPSYTCRRCKRWFATRDERWSHYRRVHVR